jgi:hypothetical protein
VNTFTIKEVSGMDYMAYYRNREAFQLFQEHSTHLRKEREQAKRQVASSRKGSVRTQKKTWYGDRWWGMLVESNHLKRSSP